MKTIQYKDAVNLEQDLINKPHWSDFMAEAFSKAGSAPVTKPGDFEANAALLGMGAGFKGAANQRRAEQSSPILEEAGRIRAKAAEIEAQTQESEQSRLLVTQFFKQSAVPIAHLSQASIARDIPAANKIAKGIYSKFKRDFGDPTIGDFDHYHDGVIYYENLETGNIEGKNVIGLMYQAGIDPVSIWGQDAPMIEAGLSAGAKKNYEDSEKMRQLEMQGKSADVANKYSQINYHNAQTGKIQNEIANPKLSPEEYKANADVAKFNRKLIQEDIKPKLAANEALLDAYESLEKIAKESPDIIGSDLKTKAYRLVGQAWGLDPNIDYANLKAIEFEKMLKPILGAQLGEKEGERVLSKFASIGNNQIALKKFLKNEIPKVTEDIVEAKQQINAYNKVQHANLYDNAIFENRDQAIEQYNQERENKKRKQEESEEYIWMIDPDTGEKEEVHVGDIDKAKKLGLEEVK